MSLEDFIEEHVVNADRDPCESDVDRVAREEDVAAALAELKALRAKLALCQGLAHSATMSTRAYCDTCERGYDMREGCAEPCPFCEADALREQVKTARLEGAREAWLIAHMDDSTRAAYRDAFGEDAPMATDQATFGEEAP